MARFLWILGLIVANYMLWLVVFLESWGMVVAIFHFAADYDVIF